MPDQPHDKFVSSFDWGPLDRYRHVPVAMPSELPSWYTEIPPYRLDRKGTFDRMFQQRLTEQGERQAFFDMETIRIDSGTIFEMGRRPGKETLRQLFFEHLFRGNWKADMRTPLAQVICRVPRFEAEHLLVSQ